MKFKLLLFIIFLNFSVFGASRYLDSDVTGTSANTGLSWANAWTNTSSVVFGFGNVGAGDTLWVSDGSYGELTCDDGVEGAPVTVKFAQESGHTNRSAVFTGFNLWGNWITIDGARYDSYTNSVTNVFNLWAMTNNIGIVVSNGGVYPGSGNNAGHRLLWLDIGSPGDTNRNVYGVKWNADDPLYQCEVGWCYIHQSGYDNIAATASNATNWNGLVVHHTILWEPEDDCYEGVACTIHHCLMGRSRSQSPSGSDPDGTQTVGNYFRFYNNVLFDMGNSLFQNQGQAEEGGHYGYHQIYGNVFFFRNYPWLPGQPTILNDLEMKWYPASEAWNRYGINYSNWIIANNTFYRLRGAGMTLQARVVAPTPPGWISNIYVTNISVLNNLWLSCTGGTFSLPIGWYVKEEGSTLRSNYWHWAADNVRMDYNVFSTNDGQTITIGHASSYSSGEALSAGSSFKSNFSSVPNIPGMHAFDFRPASTDTVVRGRGTNLAAWDLPGWSTDLYGIPRGSTPTIGAIEASPTFEDTNLLLHITFDNIANAGYPRWYDYSGNNRHGEWFSRPGGVFPTNFPGWYRPYTGGITNTPGRSWRNSLDMAAEFRWFTNADYGNFLKDGMYVAITNCSGISNYPQMSVTVWAKFNNYTNVQGLTSYDHYDHQNDDLISFGSIATPTKGAWNLGRYSVQQNVGEVRFYVNTNNNYVRSINNYPEGNMVSSGGDSTNWHHYAFTWNNGVWIGYYDGTAFATNDLSATTTELVLGHSNIRDYDWIGIGVDPNLGTPQLENESGEDYPNNGFHDGLMDDVRIYTKTLSASEIAVIANGANFNLGGGENGGGGGNTGIGGHYSKRKFFNIRLRK